MKVSRNPTHVNPRLTRKGKKSSDFYDVNFIGTFPSCPYIQRRESGSSYSRAEFDSHTAVFLLFELPFPYQIPLKKIKHHLWIHNGGDQMLGLQTFQLRHMMICISYALNPASADFISKLTIPCKITFQYLQHKAVYQSLNSPLQFFLCSYYSRWTRCS